MCLSVVCAGDGLAAAVQSTFNGENVALGLLNESIYLAVGDVIKVRASLRLSRAVYRSVTISYYGNFCISVFFNALLLFCLPVCLSVGL